MKSSLVATFSFCLLLVGSALAQIPNGGFEDWEPIETYLKPLHWQTNQDTNYARLTRDTLAVEGDYSMLLSPGAPTAWQDCRSMASINLGLEAPVGNGKALTFYAKSIPHEWNEEGTAYLEVKGKMYAAGSFMNNYLWRNLVAIEQFTKFEILIENPNVDSITIQIIGGAINGESDGCENLSYSWIDDMRIQDAGSLGLSEEDGNIENFVAVYPNPSNGRVYIDAHNIAFKEYKIMDAMGNIIETGPFASSLEFNQRGLYFLNLINKDKGISIVKLVVIGG